MKKNTLKKNINTVNNVLAKKDTIVKAFTFSMFYGKGLNVCVLTCPLDWTFEDVCIENDIPLEDVISYMEIGPISREEVQGLCEHIRKNLQRIA